MVKNDLFGGYVNITGTGFDNEIRVEVKTDKGYKYVQVDERVFHKMLEENLHVKVVAS